MTLATPKYIAHHSSLDAFGDLSVAAQRALAQLNLKHHAERATGWYVGNGIRCWTGEPPVQRAGTSQHGQSARTDSCCPPPLLSAGWQEELHHFSG
jgi:hypothetical protein